MKALSIRQPWCHHILHDGKDVENRSWPTKHRGKVLIHASSKPEDAAYCRRIGAPLGGIVGMMEITDCVTAMESRWFFGPYGFVIGRSRPLPFVPCKGALGFFDVPPEIMAAVKDALAQAPDPAPLSHNTVK